MVFVSFHRIDCIFFMFSSSIFALNVEAVVAKDELFLHIYFLLCKFFLITL